MHAAMRDEPTFRRSAPAPATTRSTNRRPRRTQPSRSESFEACRPPRVAKEPQQMAATTWRRAPVVLRDCARARTSPSASATGRHVVGEAPARGPSSSPYQPLLRDCRLNGPRPRSVPGLASLLLVGIAASSIQSPCALEHRGKVLGRADVVAQLGPAGDADAGPAGVASGSRHIVIVATCPVAS